MHIKTHFPPASLSHLQASSLSNALPKMFTNIDTLKEKYPHNYTKLREKETIDLPIYPLNATNHPSGNMQPWNVTTFPENFVFVLPKGRIFGRHGLCITPENEIIFNTLQEWEDHNLLTLFPEQKMPWLKLADQRLAVIGLNGAASYYHWMFEVLPRLQLLKNNNIEFDKLYLPSISYPFQTETLQRMGIYNDQIHEGYNKTYIETRELIIPSLVTSECGTHPFWVCEFLKSTFLEKPENECPEKKIFIVRRETTSSSKRIILNEAEVFDFLQLEGFEKIILEDLTVVEQAYLFSRTKIVVAAHGAGLTNLVFCQPKTLVIEIFNPQHLDETYWFLSHQLGLNHHCLNTSTDTLTITQKENCDIHVPIDSLRQILFSSIFANGSIDENNRMQ